jgi:hypothetical protein
MQETVWKKEKWKTLVNTKIVTQHETQMRKKTLTNWKLEFLNIQMACLADLTQSSLIFLLLMKH